METKSTSKKVESLYEKEKCMPRIVVPEELLNPHPLVKISRKHYYRFKEATKTGTSYSGHIDKGA